MTVGPLFDLTHHHAWASRTLLAFCHDLGSHLPDAGMPGTFGPIIETWRHIIDNEAWFVACLASDTPTMPWSWDEAVDLRELIERQAQNSALLAATLKAGVDFESEFEEHQDDRIVRIRRGVFYNLVIWHADEHRAQICSILGANDIEPPRLWPWIYARETGRSVVTP